MCIYIYLYGCYVYTIYIWRCPKLASKSSIFNVFPIIDHPAIGVAPHLWNHPLNCSLLTGTAKPSGRGLW